MRTFDEPLDIEEEKYYLSQLQKGDNKARDILIERNMRLVAHIIKKYSNEDREMDDLLSIGTIGLIKAINTYDFNKGIKLATYAARCIENEMLMMLRSEKKKNREVSLNEPIGTDREGNSITLMDVVEQKNEDIVNEMDIRENIVKLMDFLDVKLTKREKEILVERYGLYGRDAKTQKTIGDELGISRSYVSRIEKKALLKLRKAFDNTYKM